MAEYDVDVLVSLTGDEDVKTRLRDLGDRFDEVGGRTRGAVADAMGDPAGLERGANAMERVGNAANILVGAVGVIVANEATQQFFDLWRQSNQYEATANVFERTSAAMGGMNAVLPTLQSSLQGMVDNEALMKAFNTLPADVSLTVDQLGEMLNTARVLGGEGADSVQEFADAFAARSWDRLRDFGIDADQTKVRIDELTDAGMEMQEAFDTAVWEGMADAAERLGPALSGMVEPMQLISVQAKNIKDSALDAFFQTMDEGIIAGWQLTQLPGLQGQLDAQRQGRIDEATNTGRIETLMSLFAGADREAIDSIGIERSYQVMEALARAAQTFAEENQRGVYTVDELEAAYGRTFGLVNFQFDDSSARMANFYLGWMFQQEQLEQRMQILARDREQDSVGATGIPGLGDMTTGAVPPGIAATETSVSYSREQVDAMAERLEGIEVGELAATLVINDVRVAAAGWESLREMVRDEVVAVLGTAVRDNGGTVPGQDVRRTNGRM